MCDTELNLNLDECVRELSENDILHIGAQTNYFFVGTKTEYEKQIDDISTYYHNFYKRVIEERTKDIYGTVGEIAKLKKDFKYKQNLSAKIARLINLYNDKENAEKILKEFKPMRSRKVLDVYLRVQKDGICIIVKGAEQGKYWDKSEWDRDHKGDGNV